jgi:hypothetical protein
MATAPMTPKVSEATPVVETVTKPPVVETASTDAFKGHELVPANWDLTAIKDSDKVNARNIVTNRTLELTIEEFNKKLKGA